ncbi:MAG: glycosyltransferase [Verrucomicrobia bacterium]|nr:glycosyltransferase [Verrucomicrobiota bacterium]MBV8485768.1 glycosyltransferase [Verrucomicrobiota bacterium]
MRTPSNQGLRILSIAYPFAAVRTDSVGGAEQVLWHLDEALVRNAYPSVVIASADSKVNGALVELPVVEGEITPAARDRIYGHLRELIAKTVKEFNPHLLHMHGIDFYQYLPADDHRPVLVTLHLPVNYYPSSIFHPRRRKTYLIGVSRTQHRTCPQSDDLLPPIVNGVSLPFDRSCPKRNYTICLSRIAPEKNSHAALEAARKAGIPCLLAGKVFNYPEHQDYFTRKVHPLLDQSRRFIGAIDEPQKWALLAAARCLLQPSLAEETSSLVAMEALACGTPVIAMACGALPEIIEEGKTGFLVRSTAEMAEAIGKVQRLNPEDCLAAARERFSLQRMTKEYLEVYRNLVRI